MELHRERAYTATVQQLLLAVIEQYKGHSDFHDENIRMMLSDAWEELRMKPTALSPQDLMQLSGEIDRMLARKAFTADLSKRYERMLLTPFFARIDFVENGQDQVEKIVIGLYSLKNAEGDLMVHDWRAPVCSLYYDATPGPAAYDSPSGLISGRMTLKRQYRIEQGQLKYYVDTDVSIDDQMLLDILSRATTAHMRLIVSTIQKEQNAVIRHVKAKVLSVIGSAGSGKTSVAMHRAAYLMYRHRSMFDARRIAVLSPGSAFSEYISTVLPDLGEENAPAYTLPVLLAPILGIECETPLKQSECLAVPDPLRLESVRYKSDLRFSALIERFTERYRNLGPEFDKVALGRHVLAEKGEIERLYRVEFRTLSPALRLTRIQTVLQNRLDQWERTLRTQYEEQLFGRYRGNELELAVKLAVSQQLQPVRAQIRSMLVGDPLVLYALALDGAGEALAEAARQNAAARLVWWEDAPGIAYLQLKLGFAAPDKQIMHLLIDEAQDYSDISLRTLRLMYPAAHVTLLGDPNQRTSPGMPPCDPRSWGACFDEPDAPVVELTRCYRSTLPITRLCSALLPEGGNGHEGFGREGDWPMIAPYRKELLLKTLERWREQPGIRLAAVITRTQAEAINLSRQIKGSALLTGGEGDMLPDAGGVVVGSYLLMKGLEFDAVAVVWPRVELTDDERRRLYTASSRALHALCLLTDEAMIKEMGIIL
ncbi:MAG: AAA family ATPase [Eubacteriales bacterium]|nr:AAA family ATPase [Eubacteriales bacterium]